MEILQKATSKEDIQYRFIEAIQALLSQDRTLTKTSLAESLNIKPSKFTEILKGRMKAGADTIAVLCNLWNVSPEWVLIGHGSVFKNEQLPSQPVPDQNDCSNQSGQLSVPAGLTGTGTDDSSALIAHLIDTIRTQAEEIGKLKARIDELERRKGGNAGDAQISGSADAGLLASSKAANGI